MTVSTLRPNIDNKLVEAMSYGIVTIVSNMSDGKQIHNIQLKMYKTLTDNDSIELRSNGSMLAACLDEIIRKAKMYHKMFM